MLKEEDFRTISTHPDDFFRASTDSRVGMSSWIHKQSYPSTLDQEIMKYL